MKLEEWYSMATPEEKKDLVKEAGTNIDYLRQLKAGVRKPGVSLCRELVRASKVVTPDRLMDLASLKPEVWGEAAA